MTALLVTSWAGALWWVAGVCALGGGGVVLLAAWVADTGPGPPPPADHVQ